MNLFNLDDENFSTFIMKLNYHRVLKVYDKSTVKESLMDFNESDEIFDEDFSNDKYVYVFTGKPSTEIFDCRIATKVLFIVE